MDALPVGIYTDSKKRDRDCWFTPYPLGMKDIQKSKMNMLVVLLYLCKLVSVLEM